jgi:glycosyl transferase family 25
MANVNVIRTLDDIIHTYYINLEHRTDRKLHVENQLNTIGVKRFNRFNAIKMENGAIGCSMSHLKILEDAYNNNWEHILIVEDDITFLNPNLFVEQFEQFMTNQNQNKKKWDVVLFAGNNVPPYDVIDDTCIKVKRCQTTTGYLVNGHYIKTLMTNIKMGLHQLIKNPEKRDLFAIDRYWFSLQNVSNWYLIIPPTVIQCAGYSDIERKNTNFERIMTDINKDYMFTSKNKNNNNNNRFSLDFANK